MGTALQPLFLIDMEPHPLLLVNMEVLLVNIEPHPLITVHMRPCLLLLASTEPHPLILVDIETQPLLRPGDCRTTPTVSSGHGTTPSAPGRQKTTPTAVVAPQQKYSSPVRSSPAPVAVGNVACTKSPQAPQMSIPTDLSVSPICHRYNVPTCLLSVLCGTPPLFPYSLTF